MLSKKRNIEDLLSNSDIDRENKSVKFDEQVRKHSLDSDEEESSEESHNVLHEDEIEGEEDGVARQDGETRMTAFNMQEEMEEGHFDKEGHFIWNNEKEVRDNWLDNIDWHRVKDKAGNPYSLDEHKGLGDESDSEQDEMQDFDEIETYRKMIGFMKPKETVNKALRRLGGDSAKLSSVERLKRKKAGTLGNNEEVTALTELANEILTRLGNMDVYQETYEQISQKLEAHDKKNKSKPKMELDMYADDFDNQEKVLLDVKDESADVGEGVVAEKRLMWEFKWEQDKDKVEGPFDTLRMNKWASEGYFKTGVWVRKCGASDQAFYSSNRIDFELYL